MHNERFATYYKTQKIVPEDEWETLLESLRTPLPTTFRVAGSRLTAQSLNATLRDTHVPNLSNVVFEDQPVSPPVQIPWYPDGLAWQFNVPKKVLRKSPEFKEFHSFLVFETEVGNVSRQEAVSMLPPLFLDVEPHHRVMDMCAAPGSKTAQLLEALHAHDTLTSTSIPSGLLIANDSDHKRTHLLIHQSARLPSPALMVTNLDASIYPSMKVPSTTNPGRLEALQFDRILCDVPCSGDGTMRKNLGIWKTWQPQDGNGLHGLQLRILQRAMKLLAPGGRIVYSTCSLNPVENEAVIASALKANPDFHLLDVSTKLPALVSRPGLTWWQPTDRSLKMTYETYEKFLETCTEGEAVKSKMSRGHWPPEGVEELNLPRCIRIYPHLQDTGGFFVAVLERSGEVAQTPPREKKREASPAEEEAPDSKKPRLEEATGDATPTEEAPKVEEAAKSAAPVIPVGGKAKKGESGGSFKENPYTFLPADDPTLASCLKRLHLTPTFPSSNVLVRNPDGSGEAARSLYISNDRVKAVVQHNDYNRIRLTFAGTKVFTKQEAGRGVEAQWRVLDDALPLVVPYTEPETIAVGDLVTLRILVATHYPLCAVFPEPFKTVVQGRESGSLVVRFPESKIEGASLSHDVILPLWKSNISLTLMIDKKARSALSMRVFGKDITTPAKERPQTQTPGAEAVVVSVDELEEQAEVEMADAVPAGDDGSEPAAGDDAAMADVEN
ncbi:S-adenosyl-L-methionine-dependent methyltransferase [Roridomyces roridus]|uniref:S-adenosyl-L-methionine-dependent methyltransferase n=1 Tax=Roridomyces roridus TaxID=1738132 RepID=A0AAD7C5X6_9AGAR|nr:S-adenosyl-L-methionine-dependent methyltransferase [Roridomyces roridus]